MTELIVRIRRRGSAAVDVVVSVEESHTVAELAAALAGHLGCHDESRLTSVRSGAVLDPAAAVGGLDLVTGDELLLGDPGGLLRSADIGSDIASDIVVDVIAGPASGRSHPVPRPGRIVVGRARDATMRVDDPSVSRHHLTIEVDGAGAAVVVPRAGAANGVMVNGVEIDEPTAIASTDVVRLGGTRLVVRAVPRRRAAGRRGFGRIDVHRTPYRPALVPARTVAPFGPVPERPEPRRLPTVALAAPLVAGVAMYAFTRQLQFLVLTLLSPAVMIGTAVDDRRSGRRSLRARVARFHRDLAAHRDHLAGLRELERTDRFRAAPDLADLIRRAELRTIDLWARGRSAPDFLRLRLGLGPATAAIAVELDRGGADDLRDEARRALRGLDELVDVPVTVDVDEVFAIHGAHALVDGVAASLVVQAATLHSPEDLVIAAAVAGRRSLEWIRWLPHARSVTSPLSGDHVVHRTVDAGALLDRLLDVAEHRAARGRTPGTASTWWPRMLVVLDADSPLDAPRVARLLDLAPSSGLAVVWLADSAAGVPRQATRTLVVRTTTAGVARGRLWSTDPEVGDVDLELEHLRRDRAEWAARALAPLRDASTMSLASSIPRRAPLLEVLGVGRPSAAWVVEHWTHRPDTGLRFAIGLGADGPVELDLVDDGPHALVGGTSGAGKSELLQSMVAALTVGHPPTRLTFLFVDYKGGAATQVFERLPHTVGYVTNLSAELAARALTSLRAELHRRMALLDGRAKDLAELLATDPDAAPPALVIVVDEFATLAREIPDFVDGVVDIAQRGRSLGIHLVLATQRPTGAVNDNILANTNLRISLRMLDRAESTAVIGTPDAADIPVPLRGRGFVRLGPRQLVEFQAAFAGAPLVAEAVRPPVLVRPFDTTDGSVPTPPSGSAVGRTQLDAVLDAIRAANERLGLPAPRRPWCDVLPPVIALDAVPHEPLDGQAVFGVLDAPERQEQRPAVVDLGDGAVLVFGAGGSGASTFLRTVAASLASAGPAADVDVAIVVFDAAGRGCAMLTALPMVEVVPVDDLEAVTRRLLVLERELDRRRSAVPPPDRVDGRPPRVVVLVDGLGELLSALLDATTLADEWVERVVRLVVDGRQVGIHVVATADRRSAVPTRIHAAVANRIVLRQADDGAATEHGIPSARATGLTPGRGWWSGPGHAEPVLVQIATVSSDPSERAQRDALTELGRRLGPRCDRARAAVLAGASLPERDPTPLPAPGGLAAAIGRADLTGEPVSVDLEWSHLTVCGPPRSGRSTALAAIASQLAVGAASHGCELVVAGPASSGLRRRALPSTVRTAFGHDLGPVLHRVASSVGRTRVLVLDDLDALDDPALLTVFDQLARDDAVRLVAAAEPHVGFSANPLLGVLRRARRQLVLRPDDPAEFLQLTGTRLVLRPGLRMPPGRGILLVDRVPTVVQVTDVLAPDHPAATAGASATPTVRAGAAA